MVPTSRLLPLLLLTTFAYFEHRQNGVAVIIDLCIALIPVCVETSQPLCNSFISLAHACLFLPPFDLTYLQDEHLSYFTLLFLFSCQSSRCSFQIAFTLHYSCQVPFYFCVHFYTSLLFLCTSGVRVIHQLEMFGTICLWLFPPSTRAQEIHLVSAFLFLRKETLSLLHSGEKSVLSFVFTPACSLIQSSILGGLQSSKQQLH